MKYFPIRPFEKEPKTDESKKGSDRMADEKIINMKGKGGNFEWRNYTRFGIFLVIFLAFSLYICQSFYCP